MAVRSKLPLYQAQILRMWVEQSAHRSPVWRFSLEDVETGKRCGFADLDALICHLLDFMEEMQTPEQGQLTNVEQAAPAPTGPSETR